MTKPEAAAFLGVSEKTISRYVSASKLPAHYVAGKTGRQLDFKEYDLEQFRREATETIEAGQPGQDTSGALVPTPVVASPVVPPPLTLADLVRAVMAETGQDKATVPAADKLALSLDEAAALSGVPRSVLDAARKDGRLVAVKIGRGYKVRRGDLEAFVSSLFEAPG
jgi:excisionase family DNA binding protein